MIHDCIINNLAKNPVSAVFHLHAICKSVSPKFIESCIEAPCLCPSERHKHGGRDVQKQLSLNFAIEMKVLRKSSETLKLMLLLA